MDLRIVLGLVLTLVSPAWGQPSASARPDFQGRISAAARAYGELDCEHALERLEEANVAARDAGERCTLAAFDGGGVPIRDIVGFEQDGGTTLYAVNQTGDILRWDHPNAPVRAAQVDASLHSIHGIDPRTLIAVGSRAGSPAVYRPNADGGVWQRETLPALPEAVNVLHSVHGVSPALAYAVGDQGLLLEREGAPGARSPRILSGWTAASRQTSSTWWPSEGAPSSRAWRRMTSPASTVRSGGTS